MLVDAPAQRVVAVARGLDGGGRLWLRVRSGDLRFGPVVVARDRGFEHLVLGAVAKALYGVPPYAALHDVAVQVVGLEKIRNSPDFQSSWPNQP